MRNTTPTERPEGAYSLESRSSLASHDFFRALLDSATQGALLIDRERRIRLINKALQNAAGMPPGTALSEKGHGTCQDTFPRFQLRDPGDLCLECDAREACISRVARDLATARLTSGERSIRRTTFTFVIEGRPEEVELALFSAPIQIADDELALVVVEDLSELRRSRIHARGEGLHGMVGRHPRMQELFETILRIGPIDVPVVIQGESGTGKEIVAMALHRESRRAKGRLVPVNCGALAEGLLESELFGHVRGAFSGAIRDKKGRFELAHRGTIFLDEIGDLSTAMQVKLLRVLQDGTFERVGSETTMKSDARVICATNRNLEREVALGRFREDLFYRLCAVLIQTPPLRDRRSDIPLLADHILTNAAREFGLERPDLSPEVFDYLRRYPWPGNVRELENSLRQALIRAEGRLIEPEHLPGSILKKAPPAQLERRQRKLGPNRVAEALREAEGNKSLAAKILGVSRATLYRFLSNRGHPTH